MSSLPTPFRAALGIALSVVDTARDTATHLPQKAAGLPVAVASQAVQLSLRAQQQYAAYVNKGDELIGAFRGAPEEPPAWATFDEDEPTPARNTAFDRVPDAEDELDELQALDELSDLADELAELEEDDTPPVVALITEADLDRPDDLDRLGPPATPGAPDTTSTEPEVVARDASGDEVFGADAPRSTAPREPGRKATRKVATKAARKSAAKKVPPAKKALPAAKAVKKVAPPTGSGPADDGLDGFDGFDGPPVPPAKKAAKKAPPAKKAPAKKAPAKTTTLEGEPLHAETLPASPDAQTSDTQPGDARPDEV